MNKVTIASLLVAAFAVGCAAAPVLVPRMNAQTTARINTRTTSQNARWEYTCYENNGEIDMNAMNQYGAAGWELVTGPSASGVFCFKRAL